MMKTIGFLGGGHMTTGVIAGLLRSGDDASKIAPSDIWVFDRNPDKLSSLGNNFGINTAVDNLEMVANADVLVLSVKPQALKEALVPLRDLMQEKQPLLMSLAAGIRCESIDSWLGGGFAIARAMPNMASAIGFGATGIFANQKVTSAQQQFASQLMNSVGITHWVKRESEIDLVTALSGSGPAYFMLFIEHLVKSAVAAGLDPQGAKMLALQTARGTTELIQASDKSIASLIDSICIAGGTTEQAVQSFRADRMDAMVAKAFAAAKIRAEQLADELSA